MLLPPTTIDKTLAGLLLLACVSGYAEPITGKVVSIADGDTLMLLSAGQHRIRIGGIDAPERAQPFGNLSRQHLAKLALQQEATAECYKADRYGRRVCTVFVGGKDVGLAQIEAGMAWWFRKYAHEQPKEQASKYLAAESRASMNKVGLWRDAKPVPPWEWRRVSR